MKRALAMMALALVLTTAARVEAGNHIGISRWFGLGWGPGYHAGGGTSSYGPVEYEVPAEIPAPEAVNTSRLLPPPRTPAFQPGRQSVQSPATSVLRPRGEARRSNYAPTKSAQ